MTSTTRTPCKMTCATWPRGASSPLTTRTASQKDQALPRILWSITQITVKFIPVTPKASKHSTSLPWETAKPEDKACFFGSELRHHCLRCGHGQNVTSFIHGSSVPFLSVKYCRFQMRLSCPVTKNLTPQNIIYLLHGSTKSDREILDQHMVDIEKATAEFREVSERRHATSSHMNSSSKRFATRSVVQRRLSIYNWNPGRRPGKEDAFKQQIAGMWHIITLQEASEYVDHELLTNRSHMTHYAGCAVLFNKNTFHTNVDVKSIYLPCSSCHYDFSRS